MVAEQSENETEDPSVSGLTVASLKHLRRQRDKLAEEKVRLEKDLAAQQKQLQDKRERVTTLETEAVEAAVREAALQEAAQQATEAEHRQRERAIEAEALTAKLEEGMAQREADIAGLNEALEAQRRLTRDLCEAAGRREDQSSVHTLQAEKEALEEQLRDCRADVLEMRRSVVLAMAAADQAMAVQAHLEALKAAKLSEAINSKVELHISVPRVTLSYNNAPPLFVSMAAALNEGRISDLLEKEVFPHFECLWVRLDKLDKAPDGTTKREYCQRMLSRLTEAVKRFVARSQEETNGPAAPKGGQTTLPPLHPSSVAAGGTPSGARTSASLAEADRARLLSLLRSGDDRGLDSKLVELLGGR